MHLFNERQRCCFCYLCRIRDHCHRFEIARSMTDNDAGAFDGIKGRLCNGVVPLIDE